MKFSGEGEEEEAGGGSGLKSRGLFDLVVTVTALKTDLGKTTSEDISLTLATFITISHMCKLRSRPP